MENLLFMPEYDRKEVQYKLQGNGTDSWAVMYFKGDEMVHGEMLYKDPSKPDTTEAEKFIDSITPNLSASLWDKMILSLTNEQIEALKIKLK